MCGAESQLGALPQSPRGCSQRGSARQYGQGSLRRADSGASCISMGGESAALGDREEWVRKRAEEKKREIQAQIASTKAGSTRPGTTKGTGTAGKGTTKGKGSTGKGGGKKGGGASALQPPSPCCRKGGGKNMFDSAVDVSGASASPTSGAGPSGGIDFGSCASPSSPTSGAANPMAMMNAGQNETQVTLSDRDAWIKARMEQKKLTKGGGKHGGGSVRSDSMRDSGRGMRDSGRGGATPRRSNTYQAGGGAGEQLLNRCSTRGG